MSYPKLTPIIAKGATEPRYLEDRFADIVNAKDFGAKGNGTTDDTDAFSALEDVVTGKIVNLCGDSYLVDEIPTNNLYKNGYFLVDGIYHPTDDLYNKRVTQVSANDGNYNCWAQDTAHVRDGVLYTFFQSAKAHATKGHPVLATSIDGGNSFAFHQHLRPTTSQFDTVFSAGITDSGTQLAVIRLNGDNGYIAADSSDTPRLLGRRAYDFYRPAYDETKRPVCTTTSGSANITFEFQFDHGLVAGDSIEITGGADVSVGGIQIAGFFYVQSVTTQRICVCKKADNQTASSSETKTAAIAAMGMNPYSKFHELLFDGDTSFGEKLCAVADVETAPESLHSMTCVGDDAYVFVAGGGLGVNGYLVKIKNVSLDSRTIEYVKLIVSGGVECSITHIGNRKFIGGARHHPSQSYPLRFFSYDETNNEINVFSSRFTENNRFSQSNVACTIAGDEIVFCFTDTRSRGDGTPEQASAGPVVLYIAHCKKDLALASFSNFESLLKYEKIIDLYFSNTNIGVASGVGVPSITSIGEDLAIFFATEHPVVIADRDSYPGVYCIRIDFSKYTGSSTSSGIVLNSTPQTFGGINNNYSRVDWENIVFYAKLLGSDGTTSTQYKRGLNAVFDENKVATVTFLDEENKKAFSIGHTAYVVNATPMGTMTRLGGAETTIGQYYAPGAEMQEDKFQLVGRVPVFVSDRGDDSPGMSYSYGYGTCVVEVKLLEPIDWCDLLE